MSKVLIIDDHPMVREGLKYFIAEETGWTCVEAANGAEALRLAANHRFRLMILDLILPGRGGLAFLADLHKAHPQTPILVFSIHSEEHYAARSLRAGAAGYVNKGGDRAELLKAVETVVAGERYVSAAVARQIAIEEVMPTKSGPLSNREYEVLRAIAMGRTLTEIGRALALSVKTVSTHKRRLMKKLGVHNNTALIRRAVEEVLDDAETSQEQ